jgi:hypothetical protein
VKISKLIDGLELVRKRYGDIDVCRMDGTPLRQIIVDDSIPGFKPLLVVDLKDTHAQTG